MMVEFVDANAGDAIWINPDYVVRIKELTFGNQKRSEVVLAQGEPVYVRCNAEEAVGKLRAWQEQVLQGFAGEQGGNE